MKRNTPSPQAGYALLLVIFFLVLTSLVLFATFAEVGRSAGLGAKDDRRTEALLLAENGLQLAKGQFRAEIARIGPVRPDEAEGMLRAALSHLSWTTPEGQVRVAAEIVPDSVEKTDRAFSARVRIVSTAAPSGTERRAVAEYQVTTLSRHFLFAVSTPGDLHLYGAPYVAGDLFVGGKMTVDNCTDYGTRKVRTSFSSINGHLATASGQYTVTERTESCRVSRTYTVPTATPGPGFVTPPTWQDPAGVRLTPIDVRSIVQKWDGAWNRNEYERYCKYYAFGICFSNAIANDGPPELPANRNAQGVIVGNLSLKGRSLTVYGDLIVNGDMTLENSTVTVQPPGRAIVVKGSAIFKGNVTINGTIYTFGDLKLSGNIATNSTFYALGNVTVEEMSNPRQNATLVVIADGNIEVARNNKYEDVPKRIDAFFYSNQAMKIYGNFSNIEIHGGVYSPSVSLYAAKGHVEERWGDPIFEVDKQDRLPPEAARLKIFYKEDMIKNPPEGIYMPGTLEAKELGGWVD